MPTEISLTSASGSTFRPYFSHELFLFFLPTPHKQQTGFPAQERQLFLSVRISFYSPLTEKDPLNFFVCPAAQNFGTFHYMSGNKKYLLRIISQNRYFIIFYKMMSGGGKSPRLWCLRIAPCYALPQSYPIFAYRGIIIPLLCSYWGGSQGLSPTYEQAQVCSDLLTLVSTL